jgi:hypothetical protein
MGLNLDITLVNAVVLEDETDLLALLRDNNHPNKAPSYSQLQTRFPATLTPKPGIGKARVVCLLFSKQFNMIIGVAGPYSAETEEQRQRNLDAMNEVAARLLEMGHVPIIGMNAALPVVEKAQPADRYQAIMDISVAVIGCCEGILMVGESPGANRERDLVAAKGLPVYYSIDEVPKSIG